MDNHKVYCNECVFLEERPILAEVPMDSGNYIKTGTRYYCSCHKKWYSINTTLEIMGFNYCVYGQRKGDLNNDKRNKENA